MGGAGRGYHRGGARPGPRPTEHVRHCESQSPRFLVAASRLAPAGTSHFLTCRSRGGGAGRSDVASTGPALESRQALQD